MIPAYLLSVGSEILRGETIDTNAGFLGGELTGLGFVVLGVRALPDDRGVIAAAVREARSQAALILVTGGLGPTHDDLTREAVAEALDEELLEDPALVDVLRQRFRPMRQMAAMNLRQAQRIPSASVLVNPIGSAPGWWIDRDGSVVATMPGVPSEMRRMFAQQILPRLAQRFEARPRTSRIVKTFGVGESAVAERLAEVLEGETPYEAGIYARDDGVHIHFASREQPDTVTVATARAL
jgi:nicotinamide-nucleotide amidase